MARAPRIKNSGEPTVYHLISRTALVGFPMEDEEKEYFMDLVRKFSRIYFVEILGFCCMGNHFHLLVRMLPETEFSERNIRARFKRCYGPFRKLLEGQIPYFRDKWADLSNFMKEIKLRFTRYYNNRYDHKGYFWGERFKSVVVEDGDALLNCLAYIDLNPIRAGMVERPEDYRWSSIGWHVQTGNRGGFLSTEFGLPEYGDLPVSERIRRYRRYIYETGALDKYDAASLDRDILEDERENDFEMSRVFRFRYRTKYFTDSGIIGSKVFVNRIYGSIKQRLPGKRIKIPHEVEGLDGIFSIKKFKEDHFHKRYNSP